MMKSVTADVVANSFTQLADAALLKGSTYFHVRQRWIKSKLCLEAFFNGRGFASKKLRRQRLKIWDLNRTCLFFSKYSGVKYADQAKCMLAYQCSSQDSARPKVINFSPDDNSLNWTEDQKKGVDIILKDSHIKTKKRLIRQFDKCDAGYAIVVCRNEDEIASSSNPVGDNSNSLWDCLLSMVENRKKLHESPSIRKIADPAKCECSTLQPAEFAFDERGKLRKVKVPSDCWVAVNSDSFSCFSYNAIGDFLTFASKRMVSDKGLLSQTWVRCEYCTNWTKLRIKWHNLGCLSDAKTILSFGTFATEMKVNKMIERNPMTNIAVENIPLLEKCDWTKKKELPSPERIITLLSPVKQTENAQSQIDEPKHSSKIKTDKIIKKRSHGCLNTQKETENKKQHKKARLLTPKPLHDGDDESEIELSEVSALKLELRDLRKTTNNFSCAVGEFLDLLVPGYKTKYKKTESSPIALTILVKAFIQEHKTRERANRETKLNLNGHWDPITGC